MTAPRLAASVLLAAAAVALLAACSSGLSTNNDTLPLPAISQGTAAVTCTAAAGAGTLSLSDTRTQAVLGYPVNPANRVNVVGTATGVDPTATIYVALLPISTDCSPLGQTTAPIAADGSFAATVDLRDHMRFRIVAFAAPAGGTVACTGTDCVSVTGMLAVSNTLQVRLD